MENFIVNPSECKDDEYEIDDEEQFDENDYQQLPKYKKHRKRVMGGMEGIILAKTPKRYSGIHSKLLGAELSKRIGLVLEMNGYDGLELALRPRANAIFKYVYRDKYPIEKDTEMMDKINRTIKDAMWPEKLDYLLSIKKSLSTVDPQQMQRYREINYINTIFTPDQLKILDAKNV